MSTLSMSTDGGGYETAAEDLEGDEDEEAYNKSVRFASALEREGEGATPPLAAEASPTGNTTGTEDKISPSEHERDEIDRKLFRRGSKRPRLGKALPARMFRKWPRTYSCCAGIILPLWLLVLISILFGFGLCSLEYTGELDANDTAMRNRITPLFYNEAIKDTIIAVPSLCYILFQKFADNYQVLNATTTTFPEDGINQTTTTNTSTITIAPVAKLTWQELEDEIYAGLNEILDNHENVEEYIKERRGDLLPGNVSLNMSEFVNFMDVCNEVGSNVSDYIWENLLEQQNYTLWDGDTSLSFNWNRCVNRTDPGEYNQIFIPTFEDIEEAQPEEQERVYMESWTRQQRYLYRSYLLQYRNESQSVIVARLRAFVRSVEEASARDRCTVNIASASWFWFTIMTTVGYGNQAPSTVGGRAMVFTLGFLSILFFGTVLASTGTIVSHMVDDFLKRTRLKCVVNKFIITFIWCLLYCGWMLFIASIFQSWELTRLGERAELGDSYWFAYISTTTVGFGDYFLTPEVMFFNDLFGYSWAFLFGFVLLSSFLSDLSQFLGQYTPDMSHELCKRLKYVGVTGIRFVDDIFGRDGEESDEDYSSQRDY